MRQEMKGTAYRDFNIHRVQEESTMKKRITALALVCMLSLASLLAVVAVARRGKRPMLIPSRLAAWRL